jgi:hypothetical protein
MARVARSIDTRRIRLLREQIQDPEYVQAAVDRIAGRITERLLGIDEGRGVAVQRSERSSRKDIANFLVDEE